MTNPLTPPVGFRIYTHEIDSPVGRVNVGALTQETADYAKRAVESHEALVNVLRFYAAAKNYSDGRMVNDGDGHFDAFPTSIQDDAGAIARAALAKVTS